MFSAGCPFMCMCEGHAGRRRTRKDKAMKRTRRNRERKANTAQYASARSDIARLIDVLQMELDKHHERAAGLVERNWGYVGDLKEVRSNLLNTVAFISGMELDEVQRFLDDASEND
ncbi:MAG: hypothetical protein EA376_01810 [Phycisphaeraceae bacterium]|nr:MAG: hypothetical protein EA376_01810 [Phycisphaeraceae bacterium]